MTQTVLITGASGFIAAHVVHQFLEAGYNVRATVRSEKTAEKVRKSHRQFADALSFAIVPDLAAAGAFDEAIKGIDGVIHTASPFHLDATDYTKEMYEPAVNGTLSVLKAVKEYNPNVKRIVITSSFAAVLDYENGVRAGHTYTEADWNPMTTEEVYDGVTAYMVSKRLAERAAFDFVETEKPNFSITVLNPPLVYGPIAHAVDSMSSLNTSSADLYRLFNGSEKEVPQTAFWAQVDVRDLALAHLRAYTSAAAANQRYLVSGSAFNYQLATDVIRDAFPDLRDTTPEAKVKQLTPPDVYDLDSSKAKRDLGMNFTPFKDTMIDTVRSMRALEKTLS